MHLSVTKMFSKPISMLRVVLLFTYIVFAVGSQTPYADFIKELLDKYDYDVKISKDLEEIAKADVDEIVRNNGYPVENHLVVTSDNYVLGLQRIPHGRNDTSGRKPVVFLMHGIFCSSADYVFMGPEKGLGYILADAGFDVWMGNARGNYYSRRHLSLDPNDGKSTFWDFSWDEIGNIDVPTMIDYVLSQTGRSALHYIGHSQGTTTFFVMGSLKPEYNKKIISMHALAPVAYLEHNANPLFRAMAENRIVLEAALVQLGLKELAPRHEIFRAIGSTFCSDGAPTQDICSVVIFALAGWNPNQHNATMLPVILGHTPAGSSYRQLVHYGQSIVEKTFRRYDYGAVENLLKYGSPTPPNYDLGKIDTEVYLHYSQKDPFAEVKDVDRLYKELGGRKYKVKVPEETFSHVDFLWGNTVKEVVYDRLISIIKTYKN